MGLGAVVAYRCARRLLLPDPERYYLGRPVVVTGGAHGIGLALVRELVRRRARVAVVDRDGAGLAKVAAEFPGVATVNLDLIGPDAPARMVAECHELLGDIDVVFSNAGIVWAAPFMAMTEADVRKQIDVNYTMQVLLTRELVAYYLNRGGGVIAYTGSLSAHVYSPFHSVYTGTKGALHGFVNSVRRELPALSGIQLTVVQPNMTRTNIVSDELFEHVARIYPLASADAVARALLAGVARRQREVLVSVADHAFKWVERLAPQGLDYVFRRHLTDELIQCAEQAIEGSVFRQ